MTTSEVPRSDTFTALRAQNFEMLRLWRSATMEDGTRDAQAVEAATRFTRSIVAAGARLAPGFERNDTQEMLDYWYAQLMSAQPADQSAAWPPLAPYAGEPTTGGSEGATAPGAEQADKLHVARQEVRLSALARQWDKAERAAGYLLSGSALQTAAPYAKSKDKVLADFVNASLRRAASRARRFRWVAGSVLATLAVVAGAAVYFYTEVQRTADREILSIANPQSTPPANEDSLRWLSRYHIALPPQDLSGMAFHDLHADNLTLVAANFTQSTFKHVAFRNGNFSRASFIESTILVDDSKPGDRNDFGTANLRLAQFQGATIQNTSFAAADLYRASFNDTKIHNVDFSGALLRSTYLMSADIDNDFKQTFRNTGWWLSPFWSWRDLKKLRELPVDEASLKASHAFCRDLAMSEQRLSASTIGEFDRARSLNGIAWTLATWGLYLAPGGRDEKAGERCPDHPRNTRLPDNAYEAANEAIAICTKPWEPRTQQEKMRYENDLANFRATYALVLMQLDDKAAKALDILGKVPADKMDRETQFLYALALYSHGDQAAGRRTLRESLEKGYFPSYEFHVLKNHITGDLKKDLDLFVCSKRQTRKKPVDCTAEATP